MTRTRFHNDLAELKQRLLAMAGLAEQSVERAMRAYRERNLEVCKTILKSEGAINAMERAIDELALDLLAMQQPMASDLRLILACIKINADLERIGDQSVNIAQAMTDLIAEPELDVNVDIPRMGELALFMVRAAVEALVSADAQLAASVLQRDDEIDDIKAEVSDTVKQWMRTHPEQADVALSIILIARNLERIGDHATNIAEDVIFWASGNDVRHGVRSIASSQ
jgi:phosphate transport system protein